jgi:outer membrane protein TolC
MNLIQNTSQTVELRKQQVERLTASIDLSVQLFNAARADYLEVLTARRDALEAQLQLIETKQLQLSAAVGLYQSLGGGWRSGAQRSSNEGDGRTP